MKYDVRVTSVPHCSHVRTGLVEHVPLCDYERHLYKLVRDLFLASGRSSQAEKSRLSLCWLIETAHRRQHDRVLC